MFTRLGKFTERLSVKHTLSVIKAAPCLCYRKQRSQDEVPCNRCIEMERLEKEFEICCKGKGK